MKKIVLILISSFILFSCASTAANPEADKPGGNDTEKNSWTYYSEGLHYKNLAVSSKEPQERSMYLDKAIELLEKAAVDGEESGRVYYHLAEVYYLKGESTKSIDNAELSIQKDQGFYPPYERLYTIHMDRKEYEKAAEVLERYLKAEPGDVNALYTLGIHYYRYLNDGARALKKFESIIKLSASVDIAPDYIENAYYVSGYIYFTKNEFRKSFKCYKKVFDLNPNNMNAVSMLAITAMSEYNIRDAEKYSLIYLESNPNEVNMHYILGLVYYLNGDERAIEYLARVMKSKSFEGFYASGLFYELSGDTDRAENVLKSVMKMRNDLVPAFIAVSRINLKKGDRKTAYRNFIDAGTIAYRKGLFDVADRLFFKALELKEESDIDVYYFLARTQEEKKNYAMAISYYNRYYSATKEIDILIHSGYLYGVQKKYGRAYDYFNNAMKIDPENPSPYFFTGLVQVWEEKYKEANENIAKAIKIKNDVEAYYFYYALTWEKMNKVENAEDALKAAIRTNPTSGRSMNYLAYLYADKNIKLDDAYTLVIRALDLEPENGAYLDTLGWICFRQQKYDTALEHTLLAEEKLTEEDSMDPVVYDHIGDIYMKLGKKDKALQYWEKAFNMNSDKTIEEKIKGAAK
ncbi:MAG TPA: tetratricopeptide repeat protein [Spirochaetota bacterium]|nr:tetratricopeptide repeat protein [Spirochaetota bacterium]